MIRDSVSLEPVDLTTVIFSHALRRRIKCDFDKILNSFQIAGYKTWAKFHNAGCDRKLNIKFQGPYQNIPVISSICTIELNPDQEWVELKDLQRKEKKTMIQAQVQICWSAGDLVLLSEVKQSQK